MPFHVGQDEIRTIQSKRTNRMISREPPWPVFTCIYMCIYKQTYKSTISTATLLLMTCQHVNYKIYSKVPASKFSTLTLIITTYTTYCSRVFARRADTINKKNSSRRASNLKHNFLLERLSGYPYILL